MPATRNRRTSQRCRQSDLPSHRYRPNWRRHAYASPLTPSLIRVSFETRRLTSSARPSRSWAHWSNRPLPARPSTCSMARTWSHSSRPVQRTTLLPSSTSRRSIDGWQPLSGLHRPLGLGEMRHVWPSRCLRPSRFNELGSPRRIRHRSAAGHPLVFHRTAGTQSGGGRGAG